VKRRTRINEEIEESTPIGWGQAPCGGTEGVDGNSRMVRREERKVADKGRRSFLRQGES